MRMRRDPKLWIEKAKKSVEMMPEEKERKVVTQQDLAKQPVSIIGSDRDPRYQCKPVVERFKESEEAFSGVFEPLEVEINNESFKQQEKLYG